ncbi:MAG: VRR-NUC domain-containing protein [Oscillospiraceae bacterium]|jgi:hypothetical protein|nr:VRR-NUC domain-containing protein [Oscillospiraceae bacterium]
MSRLTEAQEQAKLFKWTQDGAIRHWYPDLKFLFHIPNGGKRDAIEGRHLKQQGVKSGVPDLFLPVPKGRFNGLFIELKAIGGKTTLNQDWWLEELKNKGYVAAVCYGFENAKSVILEYLNL